jgi:hypothetical protein
LATVLINVPSPIASTVDSNTSNPDSGVESVPRVSSTSAITPPKSAINLAPVRVTGKAVVLLAVLRTRLVNFVTCCSLAASSPVARTGWAAVPSTVSSVVVEGAAIRNFCGTGSGFSMAKDFSEKTSVTSTFSKTLLPLPSGLTLALSVKALGVTTVPGATV